MFGVRFLELAAKASHFAGVGRSEMLVNVVVFGSGLGFSGPVTYLGGTPHKESKNTFS